MARRGNLKRGRESRSKGNKREEISRPERWRMYDQIFLIVCEDENTEPSYFKKFKALFPDHTLYLECTGEGRDALGVVKQTVLEGEKLERKSRREVDFKWAVFDKVL